MSPPKILMLHGRTQSGDFFRVKTRKLEQHIIDSGCFSTRPIFHYPTAPHRLTFEGIPGVDPELLESDEEDGYMFAWWIGDDGTGDYTRPEETWRFLSDYLDTHGPFDGLVGFSQGAITSSMLTAALEPDRRKPAGFTTSHPPFKFVVAYSGFKGQGELNYLFDSPIRTPVLNVVGRYDTLVPTFASEDFIAGCVGHRSLWHPGGHNLVLKKPYLDPIVDFINETVNKKEPSRIAIPAPSTDENMGSLPSTPTDSTSSGGSSSPRTPRRVQYRIRRKYTTSITREPVRSRSYTPRSPSVALDVSFETSMASLSQVEADVSNTIRFAAYA
ncbi:hypothetical protein Dda_5514 [Drechslerella dactyloides]|uniref:Serine hydrolase domain-containing protein n=1 Tax=Drechslerella dactyloides TaxID=74499 RepID=A0AAD6NIX8_DREDA|nr:hypothetical protein Dda_5514 [Drechslerella dactyloides]